MLKKIAAVVVGLIAGVLTITLIERITSGMYPYPEGMDVNDMEAFKAYAKSLPAAAFAMVMLGHLAGAFISGIVATLIIKNSLKPALIAGGIFTGVGLLNLLMLNIHPAWMWSEMVLYLPFAYLGGKIVLQKA